MRHLVHIFASLFALLIAAVVVMFLMGSGLPRDHTVASTVIIRAPQGKVWSIMEDVEAQTQWRHGLKSVELLPNDADGHRCWLEVRRAMRTPFCESTADAPITRVVAVADSSLGYGGTWTFNLTALTADTTSLTIVEQGTTDSPLWRFIGHYFLHEDSLLKHYEADLQQAATAR